MRTIKHTLTNVAFPNYTTRCQMTLHKNTKEKFISYTRLSPSRCTATRRYMRYIAYTRHQSDGWGHTVRARVRMYYDDFDGEPLDGRH